MAFEFDFISATDKPALLAISSLEWQVRALAALDSLGYKVHVAQGTDDFSNRFTQFAYQVVIIEELFDCAEFKDNRGLQFVQTLPMILRRHATVFLLGDSFQSLHPMLAFQQSVHAVVHSNDFENLDKIIQKTVADNDLFLTAYRHVQEHIAKGKA
ncbi:MAG: hypothetical protein WCO56_08840 [Verrucomicrobiota bacterium]